MDFTDIYFKPFRGDPGGYSSYIWCDKHTMCFTILNPKLKNRIIALLNGDDAPSFDNVKVDDRYVIIDDSPALLVRGWGRLTGCGALRLEPSKAVKIQNDFLQWTLKQLKKDE